ncbi:hypothetical protein P154DRAFT_617400 [Amniculicola lignicola CBS 123094]|uniref:MEI5 protein n=1 Tax=Amniculicola lignicola CBS 123094 TaxID=1392246 RepID=A0A6A5WRV0_9PLEO|nr:hypothetical protein P154DRAFT_617400 [Amniculicola lignicola CBS 123094]
MANAFNVGSTSASEHQQVEAASQALARFQNLAEDFFKYQHIYSEAVETKRILLEKEGEVREKDKEINELKTAISVFAHCGNKEVSRLELEIAKMKKDTLVLTNEIKQMNEETRDVEEELEDVQRLLTEQREESAQLQKELSVQQTKEKSLATELEKQIDAKKNASRRLSDAQTQLSMYVGYTANLVDLNATLFSKSIAKIWNHTNSLAKKYFSPDLLSESFERHNQWIQQACQFLHPPTGTILIPHTNSLAAKYVRQAVMLNVLALVLSRYVFTAAPLPLAEAGLDDVLSKLMGQDANKELLFRAMLFSASTQKPSQEKDLQSIARWVVEGFGTILTPKARTDMKSDLKEFLENAANCWIESRRCRQKIVVTFDHESYPDSWKSFPTPNSQPKQNNDHSQVSDPENHDEVVFFAFPAIIMIGGDKKETIHHGVLVRYTHVYAAEEEWRKEQKKRRFSHSGIPHRIIGPLSF